MKRRLLFQMAALVLLGGLARAQPAPQLGPSVATMWPYTQTTGGNLLPNPFGTVAGGCSLASWKFLNQNSTVWSAVPDPIGGVESGNCVAEITDASSSTIAQSTSQSMALPPGFYSIRCNIASKNNNSAQLSVQYAYAGNGTPPTGVKVIFGTDPNDPTGHTPSSLQTVVTGGSSPDPLCINLVNPAVSTNPNDCHTSAWASAINQIANAINSHPNYHATIIAAHAATPANGLDPSQRGQDILTFCPAGATCPPYQAYPVKGANQLYGYNCRVGGLNTVFGTNRIFGNAPQWVNPAPHGDSAKSARAHRRSPSGCRLGHSRREPAILEWAVARAFSVWPIPTQTSWYGFKLSAHLRRHPWPWRRPAGGL